MRNTSLFDVCSLRTPRYPDQNIKTKVKVKVQLYRPGDNAKSQPETFEYEPSRKCSLSIILNFEM